MRKWYRSSDCRGTPGSTRRAACRPARSAEMRSLPITSTVRMKSRIGAQCFAFSFVQPEPAILPRQEAGVTVLVETS